MEQEYCDRLAYVLGDARLTDSSAGVKFLCLGPRFTNEWRYLLHDRVTDDAISQFLEELWWAWIQMNENDVHNKELDYIKVVMLPHLLARIPDWFLEYYCPAYGFWSCLPLILTYNAEVFVAATSPLDTIESLIFLLEYAALFAVT